ncbi:MAG: 30S ribosomal protein S6e [Candidatus Diapherotrites archaeon]|nr:30S ribosomal protein S6e [Candidatus Diapherotrites archaeon]
MAAPKLDQKVGMNLVISDPKTGNSYKKDTEQPVFLNKKVGETVDLSTVGLQGYKALITGGSDKDGFPLKPTLPGSARKKVLISRGVGLRQTIKGSRRRIRVRGNLIADDVRQVNLKITEYGTPTLETIFPKAPKAEDQAK